MKILLAHNYYGSISPSGENQVFKAERELLLKHGHTVSELTRHSDQIRNQGIFGMLRGALSIPWNPFAANQIRHIVQSFCPDVMHVHNTFPLLSPSIFSACGSRTTRVLTLHNYRLFCPAAILMRSGHICTECLDSQSTRAAMRYGCYRNSRLATLPLAINVALHRRLGTWKHEVDAFITLSEFQRDLLIKAGLPAKNIYIKPNYYPGDPAPIPWHARKNNIVFAGRLTPEKGVESLIRAWQLWGETAPELIILGEGPLRAQLEQLASSTPGIAIRFLGQISSKDAEYHISLAKLLIVPSECFEGFPMVVREAFAFGTPAAVSDIGPLPSIVSHNANGLVFPACDPQSLVNIVRSAWLQDGKLEQLGLGAYNSYKAQYTEEANYRMLITIYERAIDASRRK